MINFSIVMKRKKSKIMSKNMMKLNLKMRLNLILRYHVM